MPDITPPAETPPMPAGVRLEIIPEDHLTPAGRTEVLQLLGACFPGYFIERIYFKQLPHWRILAWRGKELVGQVGVDHRMVRVGDQPVRVFGVIGLCVAPRARSAGLAGALLNALESRARVGGIRHVLLFADDHRLYQRHGYRLLDAEVTYLALDEHQTLGISRKH